MTASPHPLRTADSARLQIFVNGLVSTTSVGGHNHRKVIGETQFVQVSTAWALTCPSFMTLTTYHACYTATTDLLVSVVTNASEVHSIPKCWWKIAGSCFRCSKVWVWFSAAWFGGGCRWPFPLEVAAVTWMCDSLSKRAMPERFTYHRHSRPVNACNGP